MERLVLMVFIKEIECVKKERVEIGSLLKVKEWLNFLKVSYNDRGTVESYVLILALQNLVDSCFLFLAHKAWAVSFQSDWFWYHLTALEKLALPVRNLIDLAWSSDADLLSLRVDARHLTIRCMRCLSCSSWGKRGVLKRVVPCSRIVTVRARFIAYVSGTTIHDIRI